MRGLDLEKLLAWRKPLFHEVQDGLTWGWGGSSRSQMPGAEHELCDMANLGCQPSQRKQRGFRPVENPFTLVCEGWRCFKAS